VQLRLNFYPPEELQLIVSRSAHILHVQLTAEAAFEVAKRSRGTPRIANRLLRRIRDFAQIEQNPLVEISLVKKALEVFEVDSLGLDALDRSILRCVIEKFDGGPVGIDTLSTAISEESNTIEDVYEPFLMQEGLLKRTPRGRMATSMAYQHLGLAVPLSPQKKDFFDQKKNPL
jgi:Holliday junction DNA helicase RuvB